MLPAKPKSSARSSSSPVCRTVDVAVIERDFQRRGVVIFAADGRKARSWCRDGRNFRLPGNALQVVHLQRLHFDRDLDAIDVGIVNAERFALRRGGNRACRATPS